MCAPALGPTLWYPRLGTHSALLHWGHPLFINFGPFPFACELMRKKKSALPIDFQANFIFQKQKGNFLNKKKTNLEAESSFQKEKNNFLNQNKTILEAELSFQTNFVNKGPPNFLLSGGGGSSIKRHLFYILAPPPE